MSRLPWFKMHCEARTDRKLDTLADDEFRVWHNLLCFAAEQSGRRGFIPDDCRLDLAIECARGDDELMERTLQRLVKLRIVGEHDVGLLFVHFEERQYDRVSDMPEPSRERKRQSRARHAESHNVTHCHPLEGDREGERDKDKPLSRNDELKGIHPAALGKWEEKQRREATPAELRSLRTLCKKHDSQTVCGAIAQAYVQINEGSTVPDSVFGLITSIARQV